MYDLKSKTLVDDRFEIVERIGAGGMGVVYKAEQVSLKRTVALKVLLPHLVDDENSLARFELEAQALSTLTHRNISLFYAYGVWHGRAPYIAMEYLDTATLADVLALDGQLSWKRTVRIMRQVAAAVAHAHRCGIVHRDLKPSNIFLQQPEDFVKVADFGLAKFLGDVDQQKLTATGITVGTPHYMSPEQAKAMPITASCDIYALGCVMYQCLFGRPPFEGDSMMEVLAQHVEATVLLPSTNEMQSISPKLIKVLETALAKDSANRFADMESMADALADIEDTSEKYPDKKLGLSPKTMPHRKGNSFALKIIALLLLPLLTLIVLNPASIGSVAALVARLGGEHAIGPVTALAKGLESVGAVDQADECYRFDVDLAHDRSDPLTEAELLLQQASMLKRCGHQQRYQDVLEQLSMVYLKAVKAPRFLRLSVDNKQSFLLKGTMAFADWVPQQYTHAADLTPAWNAAADAGLPDESLLWRCLSMAWDRKNEHNPTSHAERIVGRSKEIYLAGTNAPYRDLEVRFLQQEPDFAPKNPDEIRAMSQTIKQTKDPELAANTFGKMVAQYCLYDHSDKMSLALLDSSIAFLPKARGLSAFNFLRYAGIALEPFVSTLSAEEQIAFYRRALVVDEWYLPIPNTDFFIWFHDESALAKLLLKHGDVSGAIDVYRSALKAKQNQFFTARNKLAIVEILQNHGRWADALPILYEVKGLDRKTIGGWQTDYLEFCLTNSIAHLYGDAEAFKANNAESNGRKANVYWQIGKPDLAMKMLSTQETAGRFFLSDIYTAAGNAKESVAVLEPVIESTSKQNKNDAANAYLKYGCALFFAGRDNEAKSALKNAIDLAQASRVRKNVPTTVEVMALYSLGCVCYQSADSTGAQKTFEECAKQLSKIRGRLGEYRAILAAEALSRGDLIAAKRELRRATDLYCGEYSWEHCRELTLQAQIAAASGDKRAAREAADNALAHWAVVSRMNYDAESSCEYTMVRRLKAKLGAN